MTEIITNGFYDIPKNKRLAKRIIKRAIELSYSVVCENKYKYATSRQMDTESSTSEHINSILKNKDWKLDVIDRNLYYSNKIPTEIDSREVTMHSYNIPTIDPKGDTYGSTHWRLLYCYLNPDNFTILTKEFNLKLKEW